jgi:hypothetical protein
LREIPEDPILQRMRASENRVPRRIFGPTKESRISSTDSVRNSSFHNSLEILRFALIMVNYILALELLCHKVVWTMHKELTKQTNS